MIMRNWKRNTVAAAALMLLLYGVGATVLGTLGVAFYAATNIPGLLALAISGPAALYFADWILRTKIFNDPEEDCDCPDGGW